MHFNPTQERSNLQSVSKKKFSPLNTVHLTLRMLSQCMKKQIKQIDGVSFSQAVVIARIVTIHEDRNKVLLTISDETDCMKIIQTIIGQQDYSQLCQNNYYQFFLALKQDRQQFVAYCQNFKLVTYFNAITFHNLFLMNSSRQRKMS